MIESLTGSRGAWEVWNDVITMLAIMISNSLDAAARREQREKDFRDIQKKYSAAEQETVMRIFAVITDKLEENPEQDLLGDLYMSLDFGSNDLGQFFTPYSVCQMMAAVSAKKEVLEAEIEENGYILVNEPACGAGANIIAFCNAVKEAGINYQQSVFVIAQDLSRVTALMCYLQLSLLGCAAAICVGDTLRGNITFKQSFLESSPDVWLTPMCHSFPWIVRTINMREGE
jgi:type I restriction-modification system DNA methylase subunit